MGEWQPIETAPKDGTAILVWAARLKSDEVFHMVCAKWYEKARRWYICGAGGMKLAPVQWLDECHPTHWMPLPEPPK